MILHMCVSLFNFFYRRIVYKSQSVTILWLISSYSIPDCFSKSIIASVYFQRKSDLILQRVEPLLGNDGEISNTKADSRERLCKHAPSATDTNAPMLQQQRNDVFSVVRAEMLL
jgi:hypothetical protein